MPSRRISLNELERRAISERSISNLLFVGTMRECAGKPCIRCKEPSDSGCTFSLSREHCRRLGLDYDGCRPMCVVPLCGPCNAFLDAIPSLVSGVEEMIIRIIEVGGANEIGPLRKGI